MSESKLTVPDSYLQREHGRNRETWSVCQACFNVFFYWFPKCLILEGVILFQSRLKRKNYEALRLDKELRSHLWSINKLLFFFWFWLEQKRPLECSCLYTLIHKREIMHSNFIFKPILKTAALTLSKNHSIMRPAFLFYNYQFTEPWLEQWFSYFILKQNPKDHRFLFIIMKIKKGNLRKWKEKEMPKHYETVVLECGCCGGYFKVCVCSLERRFEFAIRRKITLRKTLDFFFLEICIWPHSITNGQLEVTPWN